MNQFDELPEGWIKTTLGEVTLPFETTQPQKEPDKEYIYIDIGSIDNLTQRITDPKRFFGKDAPSRARRVVKGGDVLFSTVRTYLKNIARVPENLDGVLTSTGIAILRAAPGVEKDYIFHIVTSENFIREISRTMDGTLYPAVTDGDVNSAIIPLPPLNEQRRIVEKIEALTARSRKARTALDEIPALLDQFRQSVLAAAFRGDLTADWRAQNPDVEPTEILLERIRVERRKHWAEAEIEKMRTLGKAHINDSWKQKYKEPLLEDSFHLPKLPKDWAWLPVELISTKVVDGVHKKPDYVDSGVPFVTVKNLTTGSDISFQKLNYISKEDHEEFYKRANPARGDILISKDGTLGVTRAVRTDRVFSIFVSVALVKPVNYEMSDYLELAFSAPQMQRQMLGTGSGLQHIHLKDLRGYAVPVAPLKEQYEIVRRIRQLMSSVESQVSIFEDASQELEQLDQAILAKAFRGELVPQDPNDEPAAVLLDRIRAERERLGGGKKRGKAKA